MPPDGEVLARTLARITGPEHVQTGDAAASFAVDGVAPGVAVRPGTQDEVQAVVDACASAGAVVACWGGGTAIGLGNVPGRLDVVLSLDRLTRIVEHDAANLTVSVEAGVRLGTLRRALAEHRQFLPLDPPLSEVVTVGGLVAANASGPSRLRHGAVRDWVLGLRAVLPDADRVRCGGKVIKNVTGYDMNKLFIGSLGTLGVVTEVTFKLLPMPPVRRTVLALFAEPARVAVVVARTLESFLLPEAIDVLAPSALRLAVPALAEGLGEGYGLFVAFAGSEKTVARQVRDLTKACDDAGADAVSTLEGPPEAAAWEAVRDVHARLGGAAHERVVVKGSVPIARSLDLFASAERLGRRAGWRSAVGTHAGSGVVRAAYLVDGPLAAAREALQSLRAEAEGAEGSLVLEAAPVALKRSMDAWGSPREGFEVMRRLKQEFDPRGVMGTGRFVGGI